MKVNAQWLAEWVSWPGTDEELAERFTLGGLEVDDVEPAVPPLPGVFVAEVIASAPHPNADRLSYCQVKFNDTVHNVVCGAPNVRAGLRVAYATPGAVLPDGREIGEAKIRDVESAGMLCSAAELALGDDASGILELSADAPLDTALDDYLGGEDTVFDIDLTPNRGDCLSVLGIARETAVLCDTTAKAVEVPDVAPVIDARFPVTLAAPSACSRYAGRVIQGVNAAAPTPMWMRERLRRCGVRSINAVVDVTNFVMLELGQPMHGFDLNRLAGEIIVREAVGGETLELLDGQNIDLEPGTLVIADAQAPVALAGVMGGAKTGVELDTENVFLESAYFDPITLAGVARRYRLHTDASHRFERGVDFTGQARAIERATALIVEICGGVPGPTAVAETVEHVPTRAAVEFRYAEIERILGIDMAPERADAIFRGLACEVAATGEPNVTQVIPPPFRFDLAIEADLLEEVARIHGYDNIPESEPAATMALSHESSRRDQDQRIRDFLITNGYFETVTYSFIDEPSLSQFSPGATPQILANPISSDMSHMRPSIWPGLLKVAHYNHNRQAQDLRLFELGLVFERHADKLSQRHVAAGLAVGRVAPEQWAEAPRDIDFFDIKQTVNDLFFRLYATLPEWRAEPVDGCHPGQCASLWVAEQRLGRAGVLHPRLVRDSSFASAPVLFEIDLEILAEPTASAYLPISKFPAVRRDISYVLGEQVPAKAVIDSIRGAAGETLRDLQLFDVFRGQGIDSDKKSLTLGLIFQAHSSTLTDEEIEAIMKRVLLQLHDDFAGTLRN